MDKTQFLEKIKEIGLCEDEATRRSMLAEMSDEVSKVYDSNESLTASNAQFTQDNETLRQANMKLFLRVGESKSEAQVMQDSTGASAQVEAPKRKFEDLLNEKGMF